MVSGYTRVLGIGHAAEVIETKCTRAKFYVYIYIDSERLIQLYIMYSTSHLLLIRKLHEKEFLQ
jgi:predicted acetyltransferase